MRFKFFDWNTIYFVLMQMVPISVRLILPAFLAPRMTFPPSVQDNHLCFPKRGRSQSAPQVSMEIRKNNLKLVKRIYFVG